MNNFVEIGDNQFKYKISADKIEVSCLDGSVPPIIVRKAGNSDSWIKTAFSNDVRNKLEKRWLFIKGFIVDENEVKGI